jgi:hypothetical protein
MAQPLVQTDHHPTNTFAQWYGVLGGPIFWAMQLQANYALVPQACSSGDLKWLHLSSVLFLLLAFSAVAVAAYDYRKARAKSPVKTEESAEGRSSFMGNLGIMTSGLFAIIIIAQAIPTFFFNPCDS